MNTPRLIIVIPTCSRAELLERTLASLAACILPECVTRVIIAENGKQSGAYAIATKFEGRLPVEYRFIATPNKSRALNEVLIDASDEFMIFYDDDIRIDPDNPSAYARAVQRFGNNVFLGGRCEVDYEERPPLWLLRYLPPSAKGWPREEIETMLTRPVALGFNWGAFAKDIKNLGGFNEHRGPGTMSRGQETDMQERMLSAGIRGQYLADAIVWHYVPKSRCSVEWTLERAEQTAYYCGVELAKKGWPRRFRHLTLCKTKIWGSSMLLGTLAGNLSPERRFHYLHRLRWHLGVLKGAYEGARVQPVMESETARRAC